MLLCLSLLAQAAVEQQNNKILESTIDPNAWKVEVENVAPMLKMRIESDNKEWRTHLETTKELQVRSFAAVLVFARAQYENRAGWQAVKDTMGSCSCLCPIQNKFVWVLLMKVVSNDGISRRETH